MKRFIGIDDGYDETKVVLDDGTCIKIPSQAKAGEQTNVMLKGGDAKVFTYSTDEGRFSVGNIREADPTSFDDYPLSAMNRVIVAHALRSAGVSSDDQIVCATGLPLKKFYKGGKPNESLILAKTSNLLMNDVNSLDGYKVPKIVHHEVLSEGVAAWMDFVIDEDDKGRLYFNEEYLDLRMAFIDIGGRTTDIAVVRQGELEMDRSNTIELGMLKVKNDIREELHQSFETEISTEQMRGIMDSGTLKMWGKTHDVRDIVSTKLKENSQRIFSEVKLCLKNASDIDMVVFVGGTVIKMHENIQGWFKNQTIAELPEYANGRGMGKYVRYLDQKAKK
ncbi:plasmid segregation protein ParM domain-containing protein [Pseudomonas luteola]